MANNIKDQFQELIKKLREEMENNPSWIKDWNIFIGNYETKRPYSGFNVLLLPFLMAERGHKKPYFLTFAQAKKMGYSIKKGSKSYPLFFYKMVEKEVENEETGEKETKSYPILKKYNIFNIEDIEGIEEEAEIAQFSKVSFSAIDKRVFSIVNRQYGNPAYVVGKNTIKMPNLSEFNNEYSYMATLFHELSHWTKERGVERKRFEELTQDKLYAYEELVAEISATMLCKHFGVEYPIERHAGYLKSWLSRLDDSEFYHAVKDAVKAFEYITTQVLNDLEENNEIKADAKADAEVKIVQPTLFNVA